MMRLIKKAVEMQDTVFSLRKQGEKIGLVPTMGYLHDGHLSLVKKAGEECTVVVISVFVNPLQFGPGEDLDRYPRDLKRDHELAEKHGVDYFFNPGSKEMYGEDFRTTVSVGDINRIMCGRYRPVHFDGVCTVVLKLFNIVQPDVSYFGEKDYQQLVIIRKMVHDLDIPVEIAECPVVREKDGLAMSSRNRYLSSGERRDATVLYRTLKKAGELIRNGEQELGRIEEQVKDIFSKTPAVKKVDYFEFRDPENLDEIKDLAKYLNKKPYGRLLIASAIWIGKTRIIDNIIVRPGILIK